MKIVLTAAFVIFFSLVFPGKILSQTSRPNVLFIAVDDLNDWIGPLNGYPGIRRRTLISLQSRE